MRTVPSILEETDHAPVFHRPVGAVVNVTPTVESDGSIVLTLEAERTRLASSAMTTIRVASGQTVLVSGAKTVDQDRSGELLILASARVIDRKN